MQIAIFANLSTWEIYQLGNLLKWLKNLAVSFFVSAMLQGPTEEITATRDRKLEAAREARRVKRAQANEANQTAKTTK